MERLSLIGVALMAGLLAGKLAQYLRLPKVSGFLLLGLALGPSGLGFIPDDTVSQLRFLSRLAIALVLFDIGGEFDLREIRRLKGRHLLVSLGDVCTTGLAVALTTWWLGLPAPAAVLLGVIAMDTSPTVTVLVLKECQSRGPLTQLIFGVVATDVVLAICGFWIVVGVLDLIGTGSPTLLVARTFPAIGGALLAGILFGLVLEAVARAVKRDADLLVLVFGALLALVGFAPDLGISTMLATVIAGAVVANRHSVRGRLFDVLKPITGLLYLIFFILAGASLHLGLMREIGAIGVGYLLARFAGKVTGSALGLRAAGLAKGPTRFLPLAMTPHAGVAIGLLLSLDTTYPEYSSLLKVVVLSAIVVFEIVGPILTRWSLQLAGEARSPVDTYDLDVLESGQEEQQEAPTT